MTNFLGAADNYFDLYHKGHDFVLEHVEMSAAETLKVNQLIQDHGGVLIMVPHNFGTLYSTLEMNRTMPLLLVVRNSPTIERTKIAVDFFTRMQFKILLVRGGNPVQHARALLSTLKSDKAVVATVDSLDRSKDRVDVEMFGRQVGLSPWATRIAARLNVPVIPTYCKSRGRELSVVLGSPLISKDLRELTQHYAHFFEQNILEDPASWAFLGDKHWGKVLRKASTELDNA
jgi:lauroyl/myristoyl acyltransferase